MKLKIQEISDDGMDLEISSKEDSWFRHLLTTVFKDDFPKEREAAMDLHLLRSCDNISINGVADIPLAPSCARCLEAFDFPLRTTIVIHLAPAPDNREELEAVGDGDKGDADDVNFAFYKGHEIDLSGILREIFLLEIPFRYLCSEDCKGLCPKCGLNLNTEACQCASGRGDPRFAVLRGLLSKN